MTLKDDICAKVLALSRNGAGIGKSGLSQKSQKVFELQGCAKPLRSMLEVYELNLLYVLARDYYKDGSYIIDAGCLFGASTLALAGGLRERAAPAGRSPGPIQLLAMLARRLSKRMTPAPCAMRPIQSFDLFETNPPYDAFFHGYHDFGPTSNALYAFLDFNKGNLDLVSPHQGDFLRWVWNPEDEISIIFNDLSKTVSLNNKLIAGYFPSLVPGESYVVQQDYVHFAEWWIAASMEYFKEYFDELGFFFGATKLFRLKSPIASAAADFDMRDMEFSTIERLLLSAIERAPATVAEALTTALGMFYIDHDKPDLALQTVLPLKFDEETMDLLLRADVPAHENFAAILPSNRRQVIQYAREGTKNAV